MPQKTKFTVLLNLLWQSSQAATHSDCIYTSLSLYKPFMTVFDHTLQTTTNQSLQTTTDQSLQLLRLDNLTTKLTKQKAMTRGINTII